MEYLIRPVEPELFENQLEHLEMVILLIAHHIYVRIQLVFRESAFCGTEILGNIHRCTIGAEKQFAVKSVGGKVTPYRPVRIFYKDSHIQASLYEFLTEKISIVLIISLVEGDTKSLVGLLESGKHPLVHHLPESSYLRVAFFPFHKHLMHVIHDGRIFFFHLGKLHIAVTYQMIAFFASTFRRSSVKTLFPRIHGLADMYSAVVYKRGFDNVITCGRKQI